MKKKKLVILDIQPIDPPKGGGRLRLLGLYSNLGEKIDATYVGTYQVDEGTKREISLSQNLKEIDIPLGKKYFAKHDYVSRNLGKWCLDVCFPKYGYLAKELIDESKKEIKSADIIIFSHPWMFKFIAPFINNKKQLVVYDAQNFEGALNLKLFYNESSTAELICKDVIRCEWELSRSCDCILTCLDHDKKNFNMFYGVENEKIKIYENGAFANKIIPCKDKEIIKNLKKKFGINKFALIFMGSTYPPNVEAARFILKISKELPQFQFILLGEIQLAMSDVDLSSYKNVIIPGFVDDQTMHEYLWASDMAINPMMKGSGSNVKMFEFMAAGLPILATEVGARGIENVDNNTYEVSSIDDFKNSIISLYNDDERRSILAKTSREVLCEKYDWNKLSEKLGIELLNQYDQKFKKL